MFKFQRDAATVRPQSLEHIPPPLQCCLPHSHALLEMSRAQVGVRVLEMMYSTARFPEYTSFTRAFLLPVRAILIPTALVGVWKL